MAELTKIVKRENKVFDIAKPSSTPADATSKSIIVNHGPVMRDPTLVEQSPETTNSTEPVLKVSHELTLEPSADTISSLTDQHAESSPITVKIDSPSVSEEPQIAPKPEVIPTPEIQEVKPAEKSEAEMSDLDKQKNDEQEKQAAEERAVIIDDIVSSGKYFLPINMIEKKKNQRMAVYGVILCLLLAVAWVDVALDAGLIGNNLNIPHTHFFALKP